MRRYVFWFALTTGLWISVLVASVIHEEPIITVIGVLALLGEASFLYGIRQARKTIRREVSDFHLIVRKYGIDTPEDCECETCSVPVPDYVPKSPEYWKQYAACKGCGERYVNLSLNNHGECPDCASTAGVDPVVVLEQYAVASSGKILQPTTRPATMQEIEEEGERLKDPAYRERLRKEREKHMDKLNAGIVEARQRVMTKEALDEAARIEEEVLTNLDGGQPPYQYVVCTHPTSMDQADKANPLFRPSAYLRPMTAEEREEMQKRQDAWRAKNTCEKHGKLMCPVCWTYSCPAPKYRKHPTMNMELGSKDPAWVEASQGRDDISKGDEVVLPHANPTAMQLEDEAKDTAPGPPYPGDAFFGPNHTDVLGEYLDAQDGKP